MKIRRIIIDREAAGDPLSDRIRARLPELPVSISGGVSDLLAGGPPGDGSLVLTRHRGAFVKDFPSTPGSPPCGEKYIMTMLNCPFSCSYCYLQSYLEHGLLVIFTDTARMKEEVARVIESDRPARMTTGEMGDSLVFDRLTGTTMDLLPLFKGTSTMLEVRTKSTETGHLLGCGSDNLIITWTLSPAPAILAEEAGSAPLDSRLDAIAEVTAAGILTGIRFDPVIPSYYDADAYGDIVEKIASTADRSMIHRFEIGILRFPPGLWECAGKKRPASPLLRGEYFRDIEGKMRYYRPERVRIYREIFGSIRSAFPDTPVELSMEDVSVWEDAGIGILTDTGMSPYC